MQPIIVKKIKKGGGDGHHGGAWKVAYADFVTAMMAFFLLMWLLNATSEDQRKGLADFFDPQIPISRSSAGGAGMLGGEQLFVDPNTTGTQNEGVRPRPTASERGEDLGDLAASPNKPEAETTPDGVAEGAVAAVPDSAGDPDGSLNTDGAGETEVGLTPGEGADLEAAAMVESDAETDAEIEAQRLDGVAEDLLEEVRSAGGDGLLDHFSMRMTPEGLVIEIIDLSGDPLFRSGSAEPAPVMNTLIDILVPVLGTTVNDIAVSGHTDASPFNSRAGYSNWELSADRANAARRLMTARGLEEGRIVRVSGHAAKMPFAADPFAPKNRRIAITILRSTPAEAQ